jgi:2,5-diamino-6-(ribosylamino)-4(3H)-pyrimidinone 5'-phosphate reductase
VSAVLPRVILHNAVSVDGRMDWIAPDLGLFYELAGRWQEDATLAGCDTLLQGLAEEPEPTDGAEPEDAEGSNGDRPLLVVPDSRGRLRQWDRIRQWPYWRDGVVLCSRTTPQAHLRYLESQNIDHILAGDDHVDLRAALQELNHRYGVGVVRVDAGGTLNGALLRAGLVDEVSVLILPSLIGGMTPRHTVFCAPDLTSPEDMVNLRLAEMESVREDIVWLRYEVQK